MIPPSRRWAVLVVLLLGCGLWTRFIQGERSPERTVRIPFAEPGRVDLVTVRGAWLRAAEIASADYFGGLKTPPNPTPLEECLLRRESYDVEVWSQQELGDGGQDEDQLDEDAGSSDAGEPDAGHRFDAPVPRILFVSISLHWDACELGESPPTDMGGQYAIDTTTWQIVGWRQ